MAVESVAVTGGAGRLGTHIADAVPDGQVVTAIDIAPPPRPDVDFVEADISDREALTKAFAGHDAVMHLAAIPNLFAAAPDVIMQVNVQGTWNVLQAAESAGVRRVVLCSSDSATGYTLLKEHMTLPRYLPLDEAHVLRPSDAYGLSKLLGEEVGRSFARRGRLEVVALRPPFILFEDFHAEIAARVTDPENYDGPVAGAPRAAGGGPWFHYVESEDVARAFWLALEPADVSFDVFFVSATTTYAPAPTLQIVERFFGELPDVTKPEVYRDNPLAPLFDLGRARDILGFEAQGTTGRRLADEALGSG